MTFCACPMHSEMFRAQFWDSGISGSSENGKLNGNLRNKNVKNVKNPKYQFGHRSKNRPAKTVKFVKTPDIGNNILF